MQLYLYSLPNGLNCMDKDITACFVVNCVRSLIPKDSGVLLKSMTFPLLFQTTG